MQGQNRLIAAVQFLVQVAHLRELAFDSARLLIQVYENGHFGVQHFGRKRLEQVIDRAQGVALVDLGLALVKGSQENDGGMARLGPLTNQRGNLEAVNVRQLDVEQNQGKLLLEQAPQSRAAR